MLNKVIVMGRLGHDPEMRRTQNGTAVAAMTLAVDRDFKDKATGDRGVDWVDVVAWRQTAEFLCRYFTKGRMAVVEGRLQTRTYTDQSGVKRKVAEVVADHIYFGDSRPAAVSEGNVDEGSLPLLPTNDYQDLDDDGELPF